MCKTRSSRSKISVRQKFPFEHKRKADMTFITCGCPGRILKVATIPMGKVRVMESIVSVGLTMYLDIKVTKKNFFEVALKNPAAFTRDLLLL